MKTRLHHFIMMMSRALSLVVLLCICFQNQIFALEKTKPNEPGPWPELQVNTYTGNLFYQRSDLLIPTRGEIPLSILFSYNSLKHQADCGYGNGWSFSFGMYYSYSGNNFTVYREDGQEDVFTWNGSAFDPPVGVYDVLVENASGEYLLTTKYGIKYYFESISHKQLTKIEDRNGNAMTLSYSGGDLVTITDPSGRVLILGWSNGHLMQITDPNTTPSRVIAFSYDGSWNMTQVTRPLSNTWQYSYDVNGNMTSVTDPRYNTATISYDINEAVAGLNCVPVNYNKTFTYNNCNNTTTVSQVVSLINRQTIYTFDLAGRVISKQFPDGNSVSYTWDNQNNIITYTNEMGSATTYTYDAKSNLLSETDCRGNAEIFTYGSTYNLITSFQNKNGNLTSFAYDVKGNLTGITDCFNNAEINTFNAYGQIITSKDKNNQTTSYSYDAYGNPTGLTDPLSFSQTRTYDQVGNILTEMDKRGFTTTYSYDLLNRLTGTLDVLGYTTSYTYDGNGHLTSETDQNARVNTYSYDPLGRRIGKTDARGGTFTWTYDEAGNVISETNARGFTTSYIFNSRNWLTGVTDCLTNSESYTYNAAGFMLSSTDKGGNTTNYSYNCLGQLTLLTDPNAFTESSTYDAAGNQTAHVNKNGITTTYVFDCLNRLSSINYPLGYSETYTYDPEDNQTGFTDRSGNTTAYTFDALGRVTVKTDPLGKTESITYDGEGNVTSSTDKNGNTTTLSYNQLGRLILKTDPPPLGYTESFTYDGVGNMLTSTDRRGKTTTRLYDNLDRQTSLTTPMGYTETTTYDAMGNVTSFTNKNGFTTTFTHDCLDQLAITTDPLNFTETNTYNANGQKTGFTDKNGGTTTWNYSCCRLLSTTDQLLFTEYYGYDNAGNRTSLTNKNNNVTSYFYDNLDRLFKISTPMGNQTLYTLDGVGNVLTKKDANLNTITYSYNPRGELITTLYPDATSISYSYNNNGDLLQTVNTGGIGETITYIYDVLGRVTSQVTNYGAFTKSISYLYDQNGNNLSVTSETGTIAYLYDNDNRLAQITDQNGGVTTFQYDGMGNQIVVNYPNGVSTFTSYDANGNVISVNTQTTPPPPSPLSQPDPNTSKAILEMSDEILFETDYGVIEILSPLSGSGLGEEEPVTITVMNFGMVIAPGFSVSYTVDGGDTYVEWVEVLIAPGGFYVHTFSQPADLSIPGETYEITACVYVSGDENPGNDCMTAFITNILVVTIYQAFNYGYDPNGNKTFESHLDGTNILLGYNDRNELTFEHNIATGAMNEYTYYPTGQRQTMTVNGTLDYYYSINLDGTMISAGDVTFTADNNGTRTSMTTASGDVTTYSHNFDYELIGVSFPDLSSAQYYYSALGDELKKYENGISTYANFSGRGLLNEYDASGNPTYYYNPAIGITGGLQTGYYYYDGFRSTTLQLDPNGLVLAETDCDEYGNITSSSGSWINNRMNFVRLEFNPVLDLYSINEPLFEGYYDPLTGQWLINDIDDFDPELDDFLDWMRKDAIKGAEEKAAQDMSGMTGWFLDLTHEIAGKFKKHCVELTFEIEAEKTVTVTVAGGANATKNQVQDALKLANDALAGFADSVCSANNDKCKDGWCENRCDICKAKASGSQNWPVDPKKPEDWEKTRKRHVEDWAKGVKHTWPPPWDDNLNSFTIVKHFKGKVQCKCACIKR